MNICSSYEQAVAAFEQSHFKDSLDIFFSRPNEKQMMLSNCYTYGIPMPVTGMPRISVYTSVRMLHSLLSKYEGSAVLPALPKWVDGQSSLGQKFNYYFYRVFVVIAGYLPYFALNLVCWNLLSKAKKIHRAS